MACFDHDVTLVTAQRYVTAGEAGADAVIAEDRLLADAFSALGLTTRRVAWSDERHDWSRGRVALIRATWDYFEHLEAFQAWLGRAASATTLVNAPELLRWNLDKRYLLELRRAGLPVPPTRIVPRGAPARLADLLAETGWDEVVVKPAVSASGWETHHVAHAPAFEARFRALARRHDLLVQPYLPAIAEHGELSCVVIAGRFSHAVRKRPAAGGFLVQAEHGGSVEAHAATAEQRRLAERAAVGLPARPVYARVDLVPGPGGAWCVGELELIEPELWLRRHPSAASALASAVAAALPGGRGAEAQR